MQPTGSRCREPATRCRELKSQARDGGWWPCIWGPGCCCCCCLLRVPRMGCGAWPPTLSMPSPLSSDHWAWVTDKDPGLLASFDLFAHNNTQPLDGDRADGPRRGQMGGEEAPASLAPLPSVLGGEEEGGGSPYPPECKQQQMNKNKNTKGRRKVLGIPLPQGLPCHQRPSPHYPIHQSSLSARGCLALATSPGAESRAQNCWASSSHR